MFTGFPILSKKLIGMLEIQSFRYFVKQNFPRGLQYTANQSFLFSPFNALDKAQYYFTKLRQDPTSEMFDINESKQKNCLIKLSEMTYTISYVKIIEQYFKMDNDTRYKIATYVEKKYPDFYQLMIKKDFKIIIGDNFGDVFFKIRLAKGITFSIKDRELDNY